MNVRNCRRCKRLFNYVIGPMYCQACREEMEEEYQKVRKYIQEHPHVDIRTVSEECEVDPAQIRQWVREERLEFSDDSTVGINCEKCGKMIKSGRFCEECKRSMTQEFSNVMAAGRGTVAGQKPEPKKRDNPKMRFLDT